VIVDTDVLIWYFRGNKKARAAIADILPFAISAVTYMELMQGARNKAEQTAIHVQLQAWKVRVTHLNEEISIRAVQLVREFSRSHSMRIGDALIAGTAFETDAVLFTANVKHFMHVPGIKLQKFLPD
jgi:predicted nucleic acid-binding protein